MIPVSEPKLLEIREKFENDEQWTTGLHKTTVALRYNGYRYSIFRLYWTHFSIRVVEFR